MDATAIARRAVRAPERGAPRRRSRRHHRGATATTMTMTMCPRVTAAALGDGRTDACDGARTRRDVRARAIVPDRDGARERRGRDAASGGGGGGGGGVGEEAKASASRAYRAMRYEDLRAREVGYAASTSSPRVGAFDGVGSDVDDDAAVIRAHEAYVARGELENAAKALKTSARKRTAAGGARAGAGGANAIDASGAMMFVVSDGVHEALRKSHKKFVHACRDARRVDVALAYAKVFDFDRTDGDLYCAVISACGTTRDWHTAWAAFEARRVDAGVLPDPIVYSALISTAGKCGNFKAARDAFAEATDANQVDSIVFNSFIDVCAARGDYDTAKATLERMKTTNGVAANIRSYNGLISASTRQRNFAGALRAWEELSANKLEPTIITYGAMLAAGAASDETDVQWSVDMFERALSSGVCGVAGNDHMVASLLNAYAHGVTLNQIDKTVALKRGEALVAALADAASTDAITATKTPNARVWCALITLCARVGQPARAIEVINIMTKRQMRPEDHAISAALNACKEGRPYFEQMLRILENYPESIRRSTGVCNAAISVYLHFGDFKSAFKLYSEMKAKMHAFRRMKDTDHGASPRDVRVMENQIPDTITYNTLIGACATNGEDVKALELYHDMIANGIPPSLRTYVGLIVSLSRSHDGSRADEAEKLFNTAIDDGVMPNEFLFTSLMDAQVKAHRADSAFATYDRMLKANVKLTSVTFGCVLHACWVCEDPEEGVERAYAILQQMTERDVMMNDWCSNALVRVISRAGRIEEMLEEVKKIVRRRGTVESETLETVIRALCRTGYVERANRFLSMMDSRNLEPSGLTLMAFITAASRDGFVGWAWEAAKRCARAGYVLDVNTRSALVAVLSVASTSPDPDDAQLLLARALGVYEGSYKRAEANGDDANGVLDSESHCALIVALARGDRIDTALSIWRSTTRYGALLDARKHTSSEGKDYIGDTRAMYESLIEVCCHEGMIDEALEVFDAVKDASVSVSTVTLAFLESSCRRSRVEEWRIFDVCAQMRAQAEVKASNRLARPSKQSHHVRHDDVVDIASELQSKGLGGAQSQSTKPSTWRRGTRSAGP